MAVIKPFHLSYNKQVLEHNNVFHYIASVSMGVRLSTGEALLESEFFKDAIENMGSKPIPDMGMPKPCGEYLVSGNYYSPGKEAVTAGEVKVKVGTQEKSLYVFGPRTWEAGLPSKPESITKMPIEYSLAYGGNGLDTNMDGIGYQEDRLPCIENPDQLISSPTMKAEPAGFSVLDPVCSQRKKYVGTYDDNYLQQYFPGYPADFDWQYFLTAPDDQRINEFYQGNESFEMHNMHPEQSVISGRLPGYIPQCFLQTKQEDAPLKLNQLPMNLDTLWFFPEADLAMLIWRGGIEVADDDAEQVANVLLALESPGDPIRDLDYYQTALDRRLYSDDVLLNNLNTQDLIPLGMKCAMQIFQEDALSGESSTDNQFSENMNAKVDAIQALVKEKTDGIAKDTQAAVNDIKDMPNEANIDIAKLLNQQPEITKDLDVIALNAKLESILPGITEKDPKKVDLTKFSFSKIAEILAAVQTLADKKTALAQEEAEKVKKLLEQEIVKGMNEAPAANLTDPQNNQPALDALSGMLGKKDDQELPLPRLDAKKLAGQLAEFNPDMTETMQHLQAMKAAGIDDENTRNMEEMINGSIKGQDQEVENALKNAETAFRETYFMGAHKMLMGSSPHDTSTELVCEKFIQMLAQGKSVAGGDWACIDLSGRILDNVNLSNCLLEQVNFTGASLKNANFTGAILPRAILNNADLTAANLKNANMGNIKAQAANFTGASITSAKLSDADFTRADFTRCHIEEVESLDIKLDYADFTEATLIGLKLIEANIIGANFHKANLDGTMFLQCRLKDVNFHQASMVKCLWADALLDHIKFDEADLTTNCFVATEPGKSKMIQVSFKSTCLDKSNLMAMNMVGCDLSNASMDNAILNEADLRESNLSHVNAPQAQFRKANLQFCDMSGINLMGGSLAKARLSGANFTNANLYTVDFLRSKMGGTDFTGCNLENTLIKDWQPS